LGYSERFIDIHKDYAVALYCDNPDSGFYNGKYGFRSVSIPAPSMAFSVSSYPNSAIDEYINDTGIDYIWFRNLPDSLTVDFDGYNSGTTLTYYPYILHGNSRYSIEIADEFILDENYDGHYATMPSHNYLYMVVVGGESSYMYTIGTSEYGIEEDDVFVTSLRIYPNPSFGNIVIEFNVRRDTPYSVEIYDIMGRAIRSLIVEESKDMIVWDGLDNRGNPVRQGEYFVRLNTGGKSIVEKFTLLK
jgi:hypothetical protein